MSSDTTETGEESSTEECEIREPATDASEVVQRHEHQLREWAERDDDLGAIARATLRAGGADDA